MTAGRRAGLAFLVVLGGLTVFQLALIVGAPFGQFAWGGQQTVLDPALRLSSAVAIAIYALFALIVLDRSGLFLLLPSRRPARIAVWVLVAYLVLGTVMNLLSPSLGERIVMSLVSAAMAGLAIVVARS